MMWSHVLIRVLFLVVIAGQAACGSDNPLGPTSPTRDNEPFTIRVSEVPLAGGGTQARFSWNREAVYRLSVSRPNPNGTATGLWFWEVVHPDFAVRDGITYGATPLGASCTPVSCAATGLTRGVRYTVYVWYGFETRVSLDFVL